MIGCLHTCTGRKDKEPAAVADALLRRRVPFTSISSQSALIGLQFEKRWHDGLTAWSYENWDETETLGPPTTDYCYIMRTDNKQWKESTCTTLEQYICEKPVSSITAPQTTTAEEIDTPPTSELLVGDTSALTTTAARLQTSTTQEVVTPELTTSTTEITTSAAEITTPTSELTTSASSSAAELKSSTVVRQTWPGDGGTTETTSTNAMAEERRPTDGCLASDVEARSTCLSSTAKTPDPTSGVTPEQCEQCEQCGKDVGCRLADLWQSSPVESEDERPTFTADGQPMEGGHVLTSQSPPAAAVRADDVPESRREEPFDRVVEEYSALPLEARLSLGHQQDDFIIDCQYAGATCHRSDFEVFFNPVHGNCYVFNSGWNSSRSLYYSHRRGRRHGLVLVLNLNQYEYLAGVNDIAGAKLAIHRPKTIPFPEDHAIMLVPGKTISIGVRKQTTVRLGAPYSACVKSEIENKSKNIYADIYPVNYSQAACQKSCYREVVIEKCGCMSPYYPINQSKSSMPICSSTNATHVRCMTAVLHGMRDMEVWCSCEPPCFQETYSFVFSSGLWPADRYKEQSVIDVMRKVPYLFDGRDDVVSVYKNNILKVEVFYEDFVNEVIEEQPVFSRSKLLSAVGGMFSLWLGCSFLSFFELIELCCDCFVAILTRRKTRQKPLAPGGQQVIENAPESMREQLLNIFTITNLEKELLARRKQTIEY